MKKLTKALILLTACLPLVSFADVKCHSLKNTSIIEIIDECSNDNLFRFRDKKTNLEGFIDFNGNVIIPAKFDSATDFRENLASVEINGKWGVIRTDGTFLVQPKYERLSWFSDGLAVVKLNGKYGYLDRQGQLLVLPKYDGAEFFMNGYAIVTQIDISQNKVASGIINTSGELVIPLQTDYSFDSYYDGVSGFAIKKLHQPYRLSYGFTDLTGKIVIQPDYDKTFYFVDNISPITKDGKSGYVDSKGNFIVPMIYDWASVIDGGMGIIKKDGKWGYINTKGDVVVTPTYDYAEPFQQGKAAVKLGNEMFFIDTQGNKASKAYQLLSMFEFHEDTKLKTFYVAKANGQVGIIDNQENLIQPFIYEQINYIKDYRSVTTFKLNGKWGLIDEKAQIIIPASYDEMGEVEYNFIMAKKNGKWGVIDKNNHILLDFDYEKIQMQDSRTPVIVTKNGKTYEIPNPLNPK